MGKERRMVNKREVLPVSYISKFRKDSGGNPFIYAVLRKPSLEQIRGKVIRDIFLDQDGACIIILDGVEMEAHDSEGYETSTALTINGIYAEDLDVDIDTEPRSIFDERIWYSELL